jgi:Uma2 family endonuclease
MIASRPILMTAEEFAQRPEPPDGSKEELVRGEIVMTPPPGFEHGFHQAGIVAILYTHVRRHRLGRVVVETGVVTERDPDTVRGPDVSFWSKESLPLEETPRG